jgi:membrane protease YdiL (CAAX protease family)
MLLASAAAVFSLVGIVALTMSEELVAGGLLPPRHIAEKIGWAIGIILTVAAAAFFARCFVTFLRVVMIMVRKT